MAYSRHSQAARVLAQLVDELVHLERGGDGLDEACRADAAAAETDVVLRHVEDVIPQASLEVVLAASQRNLLVSSLRKAPSAGCSRAAHLHLGQVEVRAVAASDGFLGIVEEEETKVEDSTTQVLAVDGDVRLVKVPSTSTAWVARQYESEF